MYRALLFIAFTFLGFMPSFAQGVSEPVNVKLVSDIITVKPGESFNLGVLFEIDPGWHIYWKSPGDTGLPTHVELIVPQNYEVGDLNWPPPTTFHNSRGGKDYGYQESILLWSNIQVPAEAKVNSEVIIDARVSWLSCKEICIPGKANLKYILIISDLRKPANQDLFSRWQDRLDK